LTSALVAVTAQVTGQPMGTFTRDVRILSLEAGADLPFDAGYMSLQNVAVW